MFLPDAQHAPDLSGHEYLELLAQPAIDETALFHSLASKDASLVLSSHAVYELARTFTGKGGDAVRNCVNRRLRKGRTPGTSCSSPQR